MTTQENVDDMYKTLQDGANIYATMFLSKLIMDDNGVDTSTVNTMLTSHEETLRKQIKLYRLLEKDLQNKE